MVPTGSLYHVIVNGMAYPTDLATLRQWIQAGRVRPDTLVGKGTMKPIPAREVPALRDCFTQAAPPSYAPPTPPSYAPPQPQNSGYSQPYAPPTPPPSYAPPSGGFTQSYAPPSNPQLQNSGYSQPYTTAPSLNAPTPPPRPPASQTMAPLQPFHPGYSAAAASGYSQPYAQPVTAPAYGAVPAYVAAEPFPNEFHKQDSRYVEAMKMIKAGWIAGVVVGSLTFLFTTLVVLTGKSALGLNAFAYIDVFIAYGLAFGIFCKSRVCAILMVVYYILSKIALMAAAGGPPNVAGVVVPIALTICFIQAAVGTFKYHELKADAARGQF